MNKNIVDKLWLNMPLEFYDICTIYPMSIKQYLHYSDVAEGNPNELSYSEIITQFSFNHEFLKDQGIDYDGPMLDFFFMSPDMLQRLVWSVAVLTHDGDVTPDLEHHRLMFPNGRFISARNFDEFADIILQAHCFGRYEHVEKQMPKFRNKEHLKRWQRMQAMREKHKAKEEVSIAQCVKTIQLESHSYITDAEIVTWTYWKLMHWYNAVVLQSNYEELHSCFAHWGGKDIRKSLDAMKKELMTKI